MDFDYNFEQSQHAFWQKTPYSMVQQIPLKKENTDPYGLPGEKARGLSQAAFATFGNSLTASADYINTTNIEGYVKRAPNMVRIFIINKNLFENEQIKVIEENV